MKKAIGIVVLAGVAVAAVVAVKVFTGPRASNATDTSPPDTLVLTAVVRDFQEWNVPDGHPDFDANGRSAAQWSGCGFETYVGLVADTLGPDHKPVYVGPGRKLLTPYRDSEGKPICPSLFDPYRGDTPGSTGCPGGAIESAESFAQWYTDVPGVNLSKVMELTLRRQPDGLYVFDAATDAPYKSLGGFFPINGQLFGNSPHKSGPHYNYHFTMEGNWRFTHDSAANHTFSFVGDDDVWVFIDGRLVIDLGAPHNAREQMIRLNRLGLNDGETYSLRFFYAERNRVDSNCRITTSLELKSEGTTPVFNPYD